MQSIWVGVVTLSLRSVGEIDARFPLAVVSYLKELAFRFFSIPRVFDNLEKSTPRRPFCVDMPAAVQNEEARN